MVTLPFEISFSIFKYLDTLWPFQRLCGLWWCTEGLLTRTLNGPHLSIETNSKFPMPGTLLDRTTEPTQPFSGNQEIKGTRMVVHLEGRLAKGHVKFIIQNGVLVSFITTLLTRVLTSEGSSCGSNNNEIAVNRILIVISSVQLAIYLVNHVGNFGQRICHRFGL